MADDAFLSLQNLSVWYTAGQAVLRGLSLELGRHEIVGLIGFNGRRKLGHPGAEWCRQNHPDPYAGRSAARLPA